KKTTEKLQGKDVLIKVDTATICGTDIQILNGNFISRPPVVIGHEFSGYIEDVGAKVSSVKVGDLVTVEPHLFCGLCKYCRNGKEHLCTDKKGFGVVLDGGFAQCCVVPEPNVYKIPEGISSSVAALTENIGCCIHGINQANIDVGDYVTIIGGGFVGIVLAELAKYRGANSVCVIEPNDFRRNFIKQRGFKVIDPNRVNVESEIKHITNDLGSDIVIEAVGKIQTSKLSLKLSGSGGTVVFFGVVNPNHSMDIHPYEIYKKELTIVGSVINPYTHLRALEALKILDLEPL